LVLQNSTDAVSDVIQRVRAKAQDVGTFQLRFSSVSLGEHQDKVVLTLNEESAAAFSQLGGSKQESFCVYQGPAAESVFKELVKENLSSTFAFECDGLSVLQVTDHGYIVLGKATKSWFLRSSNYINGAWKAAARGNWLPVVDPSTGAVIHHVVSSTAEDVDAAVKAAKAAFETWGLTDAVYRSNLLKAIADEIENRKSYIAALETLDNGKSLEESGADIDDVIGCFRYYAEHILEFDKTRRVLPVDVGNASFSCDVSYEPMGVAALIVPWNYPLLMAAWKVAPSLAAGCTCVLKPSELTPLTALEFADICTTVGLPKGVFNLVLGNGPDCGSPLTVHPDIAKVAFTGSVATGQLIASKAANAVTNVSLELGGKSPVIVCEDADIEQAIDWITVGIFFNQGQVCSATSRLLVHSSIATKLVDGLVARAKGIKVGPGNEPHVKMGPIVSLGQYQKVLAYIESGIEQGASVACGGGKTDPYVTTDSPGKYSEGYFVAPTIFTNVKPFMKIWKEEIFGPVLSVMTFEEESEAIALANDSPFGLAGAVFSTNKDKCRELSRRLHCGIVWINCSQPTFVQLPWGGTKKSGTGRELGPWGLMNYLEAKQTCSWVDPEAKGWDWFAQAKV